MNSKYNLPNVQKVTIIEHVDIYIEGDQVLGDKVNGDKHEIKTVGNLNTGKVNVQGNQTGETP
jgi:hypothetical protein